MATGTSREDVLNFLQENPYGDREDNGLWGEEIYPYLFMHGLALGAFFSNPDPANLTWPKESPALLLVKSDRRPGMTHSVYWDGDKVHDPNPEVEGHLDLSEYEIELWYPLVRWMTHTDEFEINQEAAKNLVRFKNA